MKFAILCGAAMLGAGAGYVATQTHYVVPITVFGAMLLAAALADWATRDFETDEMLNVKELPSDLERGLRWEAEYAEIPLLMRAAIKRYLFERIKPGGFLSAVLANDLKNAVANADAANLALLPVYVRWFYNFAPVGSWGSPDNVAKWLTQSVDK